jgi:hypothetical protein
MFNAETVSTEKFSPKVGKTRFISPLNRIFWK